MVENVFVLHVLLTRFVTTGVRSGTTPPILGIRLKQPVQDTKKT